MGSLLGDWHVGERRFAERRPRWRPSGKIPTMNPFRWLWEQVFSDDDEPAAPDQLVLLGEPPGEAVAGLWQSTLRAEGIHSIVKNVSSLAVYGVPAFEVWVQYKDVGRARALLRLDDEAGLNVCQHR
jgi:hypothetical protein